MPLNITTGAASARGFGFTTNSYKPGSQTYSTAGTFTFTVPSSVYSISVDLIGAGGGGSGGASRPDGNSNFQWAGGGGGGGAGSCYNNPSSFSRNIIQSYSGSWWFGNCG